MAEEKQEQLESSTYVAVVAPVWLQNALLVFLHSTPELKLVACTATVEILLALDLAQPPKLIILQTGKSYKHAQDQINRIKTAWPASNIIALVPHKSLEPFVHAVGADEVLDSEVAPEQLRLAIARVRDSDKDTSTH